MKRTMIDPADRITLVLDALIHSYGTLPWNWHTRQSPFQVLIGTVLSQRTRDEKTDLAAQALFQSYPTAQALAEAPLEEITRRIRPVNYFKTKATRIQQISSIIMMEYGGELPADLTELTKLPGVGRKTAACTMVYGFQQPAIPVDTHVHRICNRIGIVSSKTPEQTEHALWRILPERFILHINELMVKHGQTVCRPVGPRCPECCIRCHCAAAEMHS